MVQESDAICLLFVFQTFVAEFQELLSKQISIEILILFLLLLFLLILLFLVFLLLILFL